MSKITEKVLLENNMEMVFSMGELAQQADGSVVVQVGGTMVLVVVCYAKEPSLEKDFLPLTVEYQEKTYAAGKIPGGFLKREGRPKDSEILTSRLIDRPIRPLIDWRFRHEIQIVAEVLSSDGENDPDVLAVTAAALAVGTSGLPLSHMLACVRVIKKDGAFIVNPTYQDRETATLDLIVAGTEETINMLEGGACKEDNDSILEAVKLAHHSIKQIIKVQKKIVQHHKHAKHVFGYETINEQFVQKIEHAYHKEVEAIVKRHLPKEEYKAALHALRDTIVSNTDIMSLLDPELDASSMVTKVLAMLEEKAVRERIVHQKIRADGRKPDEIREITCQAGVLPRTHGSAIFKRGQTQALGITTLGTIADGQIIESLNGRGTKHFLLHYSFPSFSVGEVKPLRGPSRREIGHGALAEKAMTYVLPTKEDFPYTIRIVSEILESNGSSSMATVCATSLCLMDAGVPIKESVAGIAMGLVKEGHNAVVLTDIAGIEDHCGDMDFKVAGVRDGITAIQLDVKNEGLSYELIAETLKKAEIARKIILDKMEALLSEPRASLSQFAPKIKSVKINMNKIGELIGPGGRNIRKITRDYNVEIDISDEDGTVSVVAETDEALKSAVKLIIDMTKDIEVGEVYEGRVTKIMNFGAFCELLPGKSGLLHISEISDTYVKNVSDHLQEGDVITVKVKEIDDVGRINLTRKGLSAEQSDQPEQTEQ